jgi:phosphate transport system permease protein
MAIQTTLPTATAPPPEARPDLRPKRGWRSTKSMIFTVLMGASFVLVLVPLFFVLLTLVTKGFGIMIDQFPKFFTEDIPVTSRTKGPGMGPAIVGTILITLAATALAVPLGILGAVYLHEYGGENGFARFVRFMSYVMAGVPSIVMGLFVYVVWTLRFGFSAFGGALALACLMLPIVIRSVEEMLKLVPDNLREASYALGCRKSRTVLTVVLPAALPGVVSGCLLAVARAAGETAPLLFTIGFVTSSNTSVFGGANTALSVQIFRNAISPFPGAQERAWGAAMVLILLAFGFTLAARLISSRFALQR